MKSISCASIRNHVVLLIPLLFAALIMASPALASSSNWYFYQYRDGCVVDGSRNGVYHNLTAGTLIISGSMWTAALFPGATSVQGITIEVRRPAFLGSTIVCSTGPYYTNATNIGPTYAVNVFKNCGSVGAASDYYLFIWRAAIDGREIEGSGNLLT